MNTLTAPRCRCWPGSGRMSPRMHCSPRGRPRHHIPPSAAPRCGRWPGCGPTRRRAPCWNSGPSRMTTSLLAAPRCRCWPRSGRMRPRAPCSPCGPSRIRTIRCGARFFRAGRDALRVWPHPANARPVWHYAVPRSAATDFTRSHPTGSHKNRHPSRGHRRPGRVALGLRRMGRHPRREAIG